MLLDLIQEMQEENLPVVAIKAQIFSPSFVDIKDNMYIHSSGGLYFVLCLDRDVDKEEQDKIEEIIDLCDFEYIREEIEKVYGGI